MIPFAGSDTTIVRQRLRRSCDDRASNNATLGASLNSSAGGFRLGYRGDIEGLRAVAILLVVAVHAGVTWLPGGFVGVDVFFVLSGYLITGLLVQEAVTTGRLSFTNFYARRLRRLLPAFLLMLAVTCVLARLVAPPTTLPKQASNAAAAVLWLSNFQFAFWNTDYFAPQSETALFLHTWSLGVEEQFYLMWPLLVLIVMGAWKRAKQPPNMARLKWLFGGIFIVSFALSWYWTLHSPLFAFYLMPSRAWQFALGAIVFLMVGSPSFRGRSILVRPMSQRTIGWLGIAMVVLAALFIRRSAPYPGTWALLPSFGAALVLGAGGFDATTGVGRVLSCRPLQAVGRVSYSWYLWHWPILLLGAWVVDVGNARNRLILVVVSLVVAAASYHLFETPIRHNRKLVAKPSLAVIAGLAVMLVAVLLLRGWRFEAERTAQAPNLARFVAARSDEAAVYAMGCFGSYRSTRVEICEFGDPHATHTAILAGDSKAAQWLPAYWPMFNRPGWRLLVITKSACPMVDASYFAQPLHREYAECARWRRAVIRKIESLDPDMVVLSESVGYPFTREQWITGTQQVLHALTHHARRIYLMRPTPELQMNGPLCLEPRSRLYTAVVGTPDCSGAARTGRFDDIGRWLAGASAQFRNVRIVDMTDSVCPGGLCRAKIGSKIVFSDNGHMTATFARTLTSALAKATSLGDSSLLSAP